MTVVDLGSSPGGWSQVLVDILNKTIKGRIIAIDLKDMKPIEGVEFYKLDIRDIDSNNIDKILGSKVDTILSDMAPSSTGHKTTDQIKSEMLSMNVLEFAKSSLKKEGNVCIKILRGKGEKNILESLKTNFKYVKTFKPKASRKESKEVFIISKGYKNI